MFDSQTITMFGIIVYIDKMIIIYILKHFGKMFCTWPGN